MDDQLHDLNAKEIETLVRLLNTAYFVVKEESPFTIFPQLVSLQQKNGAKMGKKYQTDNACRRFTSFLYDDVMAATMTSIRDCSMMGIMFDGAMDKSVCELELLYARVVVDGQAQNMYVRIQPVQHAHADGVYDAINQAFIDLDILEWRLEVCWCLM